ncbi:TetR/AcrR family transcriptional regulator [Streptomyces sp. NPDC047061]|uniref:TetR/AcrR family transcriptional regulator n=1 Tax=Streptomyces sp. NPDC047061 TaxID=3154605 RepID=UPI0033F954E7
MAATICFEEFGYTKTRISDIVQRAGVSHGNFYRHFTNKADVLTAAIHPCVRDLLQVTRRNGQSDSGELPALIASATSYFTVYARHRQLMRVMHEAAAAQDGSGFIEKWLLIRNEFTARTSGWLGHLQERGVIAYDCDVDALAEAVSAMTEQLAYLNIALPEKAPRAEQLIRMGRTAGEIWYRSIPWTPRTVPPVT